LKSRRQALRYPLPENRFLHFCILQIHFFLNPKTPNTLLY
jgi:hypothetical protein